MDFLNKAYAQLADLFRSMTPGARLTAGLLLVVIVVSLVFLVRMQTAGSDEYLFGGQVFSASDLSEMQKIFAKKGLRGFDIVGSRMKVPGSHKTEFLAALHDANFNVADPTNLLDDVVKGMNPFESKDQRDKRMKVAEDKQLAMVISKMNGIEAATVKIHVLNTGGWNAELKTSALVTAKAIGGRHLTEEQVRAMRAAVAASHAALKPENVAVLDPNRNYTWNGGDQSLLDDPYTARKRLYESDWKKKIENILSPITGALVEVNVELNPEMESHTTELTRDPKVITVSAESSQSESTSKAPEQGGRPGAIPNGVGPGNQPAVVTSGSGGETQKTESKEKVQSLPTTQKHVVASKPALVPKRVKASIQIPKSYFIKVWQQLNPPKDGQKSTDPDAVALRDLESRTKKDIEDAVVALFPSQQAGVDKFPDVTVRSYEDLPVAAIPVPAKADKVFDWLSANWQAIGMTFLGLLSLLFLRSMVKAAQPAPAESAAAATIPFPGVDDEEEEEAAAEADGDEAATEAEKAKRKFNVSGPNLRLELAAMIKEDPDSAANVLRNWIGEAA